MKKKLALLLSLSLLCSQAVVHADTIEEQESSFLIPEEYQSYLLNRAYFVDWVKYVQTGEYPDSFAFLDLDQDEIEELIIKGNLREETPETILYFTTEPESNKIIPLTDTTYDISSLEFQSFSVLNETTDESGIIINFDQLYNGGNEYAKIMAYDSLGNHLWAYQTEEYPVSQLSQVVKLGVHEGCYYFSEGGKILALDIQTGEVLWKNQDFGGSPSAVLFKDQQIYISGYFGPDLMILSTEGETLNYMDSFSEDIFWPYDLIIKDDILHIFYEGGGGLDNYGCFSEITPETMEVLNTTYFTSAFDYGYLASHMEVANCSEYVTLRCIDSVTAEGKTTIPLGAYVRYLEPAQNGFNKVQYSGLEGYVLSEYLIPVK